MKQNYRGLKQSLKIKKNENKTEKQPLVLKRLETMR